MKTSSPLLRGTAVSFALALLGGYVWQAQISADQSVVGATGQKTLLPGSKSFQVSRVTVSAADVALETSSSPTSVRDSSTLSRNIAPEMLCSGAGAEKKTPVVPTAPFEAPARPVHTMPGSKSVSIFSPATFSGPIIQAPKVKASEKELPPLVPSRPDSPSLDVVERDQQARAAKDMAAEVLQSPRLLVPVDNQIHMGPSAGSPEPQWMLKGQPSTRLYPLAPAGDRQRILEGKAREGGAQAGQFMARPPEVDVKFLQAPSQPPAGSLAFPLMIPPGWTGAIITEPTRPVPKLSILLDPYPNQPLGPVAPRLEVARQPTLMAGSKSGVVFTPAFGDQLVEESIASLWRAIWTITARPETPEKVLEHPAPAITPEGMPRQKEPLRIKP